MGERERGRERERERERGRERERETNQPRIHHVASVIDRTGVLNFTAYFAI